MLKLTQLGIKLEMAQIDAAFNKVKSLHAKLQEYNKEVEKSNRLLREQERLRSKLGIQVVKGKAQGLVEEVHNDGSSNASRKKTN